MQSLGNLLKKKVRGTSLEREVNTSRVIDTCNQWIGDKFGSENLKYGQAVYLKNQVLHIACLSSVFGSELKFVEREMVTFLQKKFSSKVIQGIRYLL